jgi:hypothetical protein
MAAQIITIPTSCKDFQKFNFDTSWIIVSTTQRIASNRTEKQSLKFILLFIILQVYNKNYVFSLFTFIIFCIMGSFLKQHSAVYVWMSGRT